MAMLRSSLGLYLRYSLLATAAVIVVPVLVVLVVASAARGSSVYMAAAIGIGLSLLATIFGAAMWRRRPESVDISFGELMLWRFIRRKRAEEQIDEGAHVLGLDRKGRPLRRMPLTRAERLEVLQGLATALETKDPYTHGHSTRVERLVHQTAKVLNLNEEETRELCAAAALHDVGKIRIPASILRKPDRLTIDEQLIVQEHAAIGAWMVSGASNGHIAASVRHHHERWDGNGYPDGLSGDDIPLFARVIAVADAYDAMTSTRPYRPSLDRRQALQELQNESGKQFDPLVVDAFLSTAPRKVPLAALVGLGFIGRFLRKTASWAGRMGAAGAGPSVASVGAASVFVASVFSPPGVLTRPDQPRGVVSNVASLPGGEWDVGAASEAADEAREKNRARSNEKTKRSKSAARDGNEEAASSNGKRKGNKGPRVLAGVITRNGPKKNDPEGPKPSADNKPPKDNGKNPPDGGSNPPGGENPPPPPPPDEDDGKKDKPDKVRPKPKPEKGPPPRGNGHGNGPPDWPMGGGKGNKGDDDDDDDTDTHTGTNSDT